MSLPFPPGSLPLRLGAFYFTFFAYSGLYVAWFPVYLAGRGLRAAEIAWIVALPAGVRIFAPAAWGWLADRTGAQRAIVIAACAANAACFALLPFVGTFAGIALVMGATSIVAAAALPLVESITLSHLAGQHGRYGPIRLWGSVGFIATVLGGGLWLDRAPVSTLPALMLAFALATVGIALALPRGAAHELAPSRRFALPPGAIPLFAAGFFMTAAHGALYVFLTLHLQQLGYSAAFAGFAWTLGVLAEIVVFLYLPALFRRAALTAILAASCALGVARFLALGWAAEWVAVLLAAQVLHAATFGAFHAAAVAAVHRVFPPYAQGRGQTLFSSLAYGAGGAAGALAAGAAWEAGGAGAAFTASAAACVAGMLFAAALRKAKTEARL